MPAGAKLPFSLIALSLGILLQGCSPERVTVANPVAEVGMPTASVISDAANEGNRGSNAPRPKIDLTIATSTLTHTSTRAWSLAKTGVVDESASMVTWSINATQSATTASQLVVTGHVLVRNTGAVGAPIGNVVVRLQSKSGAGWITRSANVANATNGDAATSVRAVTGNSVTVISENAASGSLDVAISPTIIAGGNSTVTLPFTATFNNDVLNLAAGTTVRAELLVTFGNAGGGNNPASVDINGNGVVDITEARVDGVATLLGDKLVPASAPVTTPVTLSDAVADIGTLGTVTFTNPVFNLDATSGTVQVTYDGGEDGGTIGNCAHLTGTGINLQACSTLPIPAEPFEWVTGDVVTLRQVEWGSAPILSTPAPFNTVYPTGLVIGTEGVPGQFLMAFSNGPTVLLYLPIAGPNATLAQNHVNPPNTIGGQLNGELVALTLNVDFSAAGLIGGTYDVGDLHLCGLAAPTIVNGATVSSFLATGNKLLAGGTVAGITLDDAAQLAADINGAFTAGTSSTFADQHLSPTACR